MGMRTSRTICRLSISWARISTVAETEPSMEFSMGTMETSTSPDDTASMVSCMDAKGTKRRIRPSSRCSATVSRSATSVKVP